MDDSKFDQSIRDKVAQYRDEGIDPGALEGLHQRLAGVSYTLPWYKNFKNLGWIAASVALISLLNFSLYSYIHKADNQELFDTIAQLKHDQQKLNELQNQLNNNHNGNQRIDTVYIYKEKLVNDTARIPDPEALIAAMNARELNDLIQKYHPNLQNPADKITGKGEVYIAGLDNASPEVRSYLAGSSMFVFDNGKKIQLTVNNVPYQSQPRKLRKKGYYLTAGNWEPFFDISTDDGNKDKESIAVAEKKIRDVYLPSKILRVLEKKEMHGAGFRWGPELQLFRQGHGLGSAGWQGSIGILGELVMSPSLRLESGFQYAKLEYSLDDKEIRSLGENELTLFPALNTAIGELNNIEVTSDVVSIPFNLKYFHPVTRKKKVFAGIGYAPMIYLSQHFEYSYQADIGEDIEEDDFSTSLKSKKRVDNPELYAGTFNVSLGMESQLKKNLFLQAALFYQKGINETGEEGRDLALFGLRSSLWFKVR